MHHSEQKYAHFCSEWCVVGYGKSALLDLWIWFINGTLDWLQNIRDLELISHITATPTSSTTLGPTFQNTDTITEAEDTYLKEKEKLKNYKQNGNIFNMPLQLGKYKCDSKNLTSSFARLKILLVEKLMNRALVTPTPDWPLGKMPVK